MNELPTSIISDHNLQQVRKLIDNEQYWLYFNLIDHKLNIDTLNFRLNFLNINQDFLLDKNYKIILLYCLNRILQGYTSNLALLFDEAFNQILSKKIINEEDVTIIRNTYELLWGMNYFLEEQGDIWLERLIKLSRKDYHLGCPLNELGWRICTQGKILKGYISWQVNENWLNFEIKNWKLKGPHYSPLKDAWEFAFNKNKRERISEIKSWGIPLYNKDLIFDVRAKPSLLTSLAKINKGERNYIGSRDCLTVIHHLISSPFIFDFNNDDYRLTLIELENNNEILGMINDSIPRKNHYQIRKEILSENAYYQIDMTQLLCEKTCLRYWLLYHFMECISNFTEHKMRTIKLNWDEFDYFQKSSHLNIFRHKTRNRAETIEHLMTILKDALLAYPWSYIFSDKENIKLELEPLIPLINEYLENNNDWISDFLEQALKPHHNVFSKNHSIEILNDFYKDENLVDFQIYTMTRCIEDNNNSDLFIIWHNLIIYHYNIYKNIINISKAIVRMNSDNLYDIRYILKAIFFAGQIEDITWGLGILNLAFSNANTQDEHNIRKILSDTIFPLISRNDISELKKKDEWKKFYGYFLDFGTRTNDTFLKSIVRDIENDKKSVDEEHYVDQIIDAFIHSVKIATKTPDETNKNGMKYKKHTIYKSPEYYSQGTDFILNKTHRHKIIKHLEFFLSACNNVRHEVESTFLVLREICKHCDQKTKTAISPLLIKFIKEERFSIFERYSDKIDVSWYGWIPLGYLINSISSSSFGYVIDIIDNRIKDIPTYQLQNVSYSIVQIVDRITRNQKDIGGFHIFNYFIGNIQTSSEEFQISSYIGCLEASLSVNKSSTQSLILNIIINNIINNLRRWPKNQGLYRLTYFLGRAIKLIENDHKFDTFIKLMESYPQVSIRYQFFIGYNL